MYWILTAVLALYVVLLGLFTALPARKRHWSMALVRTGIVIVSAVVAVPISQMVAEGLSGVLYGYIEPELNADLRAFIGEVPLVAESAQLIVSLLIAPLLFLLIFILLRAFLSLVLWIVERCIPALRAKGLRNTAIAMPIGAVNGILVALVTLIPLCGYVTLATKTIDAFDGMMATDAPAQEEAVAREDGSPSYDALAVSAVVEEPMEDVMDISSHIGADPMIRATNVL